ncbi:glycosyltransferase involved in cell wall biosynthesis [Pedobacter sp. W3I1]|uniref:glycosyltransferase n=1 Tax=Pedobacter sp. W3I1 TaxID=3042291 RepID=UPI00278AC16F|nr:glycosyltransferase [Pedobacter sp. W3I1]MDQ0637090.1 glycosyltransferase involved in cell wall biosynthesis [Pedobacter sp. W3I1]
MLEEVTFAIPTYNRNEYLKKLLDSIPVSLSTAFVISDNGGYVREETLQKHRSKITIVSSKEVVGMYENWNKAIDLVQTKWFFIPSDDDLYYEDGLATIQEILQKYPNGDIFIFGHHVIDENDKILSQWVPSQEVELLAPKGFEVFKYGVNARFPSILFRTAHVREMGGIDSSYSFTAGDSLLIQKCLINGTAVFVDKIVGAYRTWPNNYTNQLIASKEWLEKIDRWQDEIAIELNKTNGKKLNLASIKDEVYAQNLLNSIVVMRKNKKQLLSILKFLYQNRFPWKANFKTKVQVFKLILIG